MGNAAMKVYTVEVFGQLAVKATRAVMANSPEEAARIATRPASGSWVVPGQERAVYFSHDEATRLIREADVYRVREIPNASEDAAGSQE